MKWHLNNLKYVLNFRFPDTDLLSSFGILSMRPISFLNEEELDAWGNEELDVLLNHYGTQREHSWKEGKETRTKKSEAIVDAEAARKEWKELKKTVVVQKYPRNSMSSLWGLISTYHRDDYPNLIQLAFLKLA
jgi:hypothetical protein